MTIKLIFTDDSKKVDHPHWVAQYIQYSNSFPVFKGYQVNWNAVEKHISCYENSMKFELQEQKTEALYLNNKLQNCKSWVFRLK